MVGELDPFGLVFLNMIPSLQPVLVANNESISHFTRKNDFECCALKTGVWSCQRDLFIKRPNSLRKIEDTAFHVLELYRKASQRPCERMNV
jgi:hypothetical protein